MESSFEDRLRVYRDAAQFELEKDNNAEDDQAYPDLAIQEAEAVLAARLDRVSAEVLKIRHARPTEPEKILKAEQEVKDLQFKKQHIMMQLKAQLKFLDQPGRHQIGDEGGRQTRYVEEQLQVSSDGASWENLTLGELVTDREWGIGFTLKTGKIPRDICKKFLIERAKSQISALLNEQILVDQLSNRFIDTGKEKAYRALLQERQAIPQFGHVVEVMIKNCLTKFRIDYGLDYEIQLGDVYDDVENKIDFIIKRTHHRRGVSLHEDSEVETIAVQITINTDHDVIENKMYQVDSTKKRLLNEGVVDDIALVQIGQSLSNEMRRVYEKWRSDRKPGGPDKLLSSQAQEMIFKQILNGVYSPEELDQAWRHISTSNNGFRHQ